MMDWFGWGLLACQVVMLSPVIHGILFPRRLRDVVLDAPDEATHSPLVSVIVPARNEGPHVEAALRSFLDQDYPALEVIAVNDRSQDATGAIMDRVAAEDSRCRVIHVDSLPDGWLGKNHANDRGARLARGDYILFTDGDVRMKPQTLQRAVAHMERERLDHFSIGVDGGAETFGEQMLFNYFMVLYTTVTKCVWTHIPWLKFAHGGVGAFNMVRRHAYESLGGHEPLRMEVADDVMMGKLFKRAGRRADFLGGMEDVYVKWQTGVSGMIRGLEKNGFAGARYNLLYVVSGVLGLIVLPWLPIVLAITGPVRLPFLCMIGVSVCVMVGAAWRARLRTLPAMCYPVAALILAYTFLRSTVITLRNGGVTWRDTFYSLAQLRENMVK